MKTSHQKRIFFPRRVPEPRKMRKEDLLTFEKLSLVNRARWLVPLVDDFFEHSPHEKLMIIGDIACGPGLLTQAIAARRPRSLIIGIDRSINAIRLARQRCRNLQRVSFRKAPVSHLPFKAGHFHALICKDSFHEFENPRTALKEMWRVLAPGGYLYIQDLRRDLPMRFLKRCMPPDTSVKRLQYYSVRASYTPSEMNHLLHKAGIKKFSVDIRRITPLIKRRYRKLGIDQLRDTFRSRFVVQAYKT